MLFVSRRGGSSILFPSGPSQSHVDPTRISQRLRSTASVLNQRDPTAASSLRVLLHIYGVILRLMRVLGVIRGCGLGLSYGDFARFKGPCNTNIQLPTKIKKRYPSPFSCRHLSSIPDMGENHEWNALRVRKIFIEFFEQKGHRFGMQILPNRFQYGGV